MAEVSRVERAAMQGEPMPTGCSWQEMTEYIALRALYWGYRHKVFTREEASAMKQRLRSELDNVERGYAFERKCWDNAARRYAALAHLLPEGVLMSKGRITKCKWFCPYLH